MRFLALFSQDPDGHMEVGCAGGVSAFAWVTHRRMSSAISLEIAPVKNVGSHGSHWTCGVVEEKREDLLAERQREAVEVAVARVVLQLVHPWRPVKVSSSDLRPIPFLY